MDNIVYIASPGDVINETRHHARRTGAALDARTIRKHKNDHKNSSVSRCVTFSLFTAIMSRPRCAALRNKLTIRFSRRLSYLILYLLCPRHYLSNWICKGLVIINKLFVRQGRRASGIPRRRLESLK